MDKNTYEALINMSVNQFSSNATCRKGIKLSEEHCRKISIGHKGKIFSTETRKKLSISNEGNKPTEYARMVASLVHKNVPKSDEHRTKIGEKNSKRIQTPKGIYKSIDDAAAAYNVTRSSVHNWLKASKNGFCYADASSYLRRIQTPKGIYNNFGEAAHHF